MTALDSPPHIIKCVVWDLDRTLFEGVLLESVDSAPTMAPGMAAVMATLAERGILQSVASRNPAELASDAVASVDLPAMILAPQYGWGAKSKSVRRIAETLNIGIDSIAFIDDDPYERAEVASALPEVLVLGPTDIEDALTWPMFTPTAVTDAAHGRAQSYAQAQLRERALRDHNGTREDFERYAGTSVVIRSATSRDVPRLAELSVRTNQFNSSRVVLSEADVAERLATSLVWCVELRDRFSDDGTIGGVIIQPRAVWTVELLMMSCRAMGRGVVEGILTRLVQAGQEAGATELVVPLLVNSRNVPLRLALVAAGYRAAAVPVSGEPAVFCRVVPAGHVTLKPWITIKDGHD